MLPRRINSLKFVFPETSARPNDMEIIKFAKKVELKETEVEALYTVPSEKAIVIKFCNSELMQARVDLWKNKVFDFEFENGIKVQINCEEASKEQKYVRIFNLIPEIEDSDIKTVMVNYGKVVKIVREKYPSKLGYNVYNGVRGIYMELSRDIPQSLFVKGHGARIYYEGIKEQCFKCGGFDHKKIDCQKTVTDRLNKVISYSDIVTTQSSGTTDAHSSSVQLQNVNNETDLQDTVPIQKVNNVVQVTDENKNEEMEIDEEFEIVEKNSENYQDRLLKIKDKRGKIWYMQTENMEIYENTLIGQKINVSRNKRKRLEDFPKKPITYGGGGGWAKRNF